MAVDNEHSDEQRGVLSRQQIMQGFDLIRDWPFCDECSEFNEDDLEDEEF